MAENQNEIITALQSLMEKSVKANTEFLQESAKIFTGMLSQKLDAKALFELNNKVMSDAVSNFIKMNIKHTENLMDFGVNVSRNIGSFIENVNRTSTESTEEKTTANGNKNGNGQINLSAKQGQQITTSFYLNSRNAFAQTGKFVYGNFTDIVNGNAAAISMSISPNDFTLESGKSLKVDIAIGIPNDIVPGKYKSIIRLEGMYTSDFDIVLDVTENTPDAKWVEDKTPAPALKKAPPRGKSKK